MAAKEKAEVEVAVNNVKAAEKKVADIKAEKAATKAKKHEDTLTKHPKLGPAINWVDDHKWQIVGGVATGGVSFAAGWFGHKFFGKKDEAAETVDVIVETESDEAIEAPFDA